MPSLPSKFDQTHNSASRFPNDCHVHSTLINIPHENSNVRKLDGESKESGGNGEVNVMNRQEFNEDFQHCKYQRIFDRFMQSEGPKDHKELRKDHVGLQIEEEVKASLAYLRWISRRRHF
jgi:hypothetical protein